MHLTQGADESFTFSIYETSVFKAQSHQHFRSFKLATYQATGLTRSKGYFALNNWWPQPIAAISAAASRRQNKLTIQTVRKMGKKCTLKQILFNLQWQCCAHTGHQCQGKDRKGELWFHLCQLETVEKLKCGCVKSSPNHRWTQLKCQEKQGISTREYIPILLRLSLPEMGQGWIIW